MIHVGFALAKSNFLSASASAWSGARLNFPTPCVLRRRAKRYAIRHRLLLTKGTRRRQIDGARRGPITLPRRVPADIAPSSCALASLRTTRAARRDRRHQAMPLTDDSGDMGNVRRAFVRADLAQKSCYSDKNSYLNTGGKFHICRG
jgi:hypothetical protein